MPKNFAPVGSGNTLVHRKYEAPARYCIGIAKFFGKHDPDGALEEMEKILAKEKDESRWVSSPSAPRTNLRSARRTRKSARGLPQALEGPDLWGLHDETRRYIKDPFKF